MPEVESTCEKGSDSQNKHFKSNSENLWPILNNAFCPPPFSIRWFEIRFLLIQLTWNMEMMQGKFKFNSKFNSNIYNDTIQYLVWCQLLEKNQFNIKFDANF